MNKGIKLLKEIYYYVFIKPFFYKSNRKILIIKNDSIGDFVIFNAFVNEIKQSAKFKNYQVDLLTSQRLTPIAKEINGNSYTKIFSLDDGTFESFENFLIFFNAIKHEKYEYVLHPTYSPDWKSQRLVKYVKAKYKIGFNCSLTNISISYKKKYDRYYTTLLKTKSEYYHEFERNIEFFEQVLNGDVSLKKPSISIDLSVPVENVILICPGAQHMSRIWSLENFSALITRIHNHYPKHKFVVVVGPGEEELYIGIQKKCAIEIEQFKISNISNLCQLIVSSKLVVCNDSSAAHIAVACEKVNVCISNGNHYKRFIPYPMWMNVNQKVVLPDLFLNLNDKELEKYYFGSKVDINLISVDKVFDNCKFYLG
jgi:ADP-heptose:LPS heptosyltransferase